MSSETDTMKTKSKRTLTPRLRFPEFRDGPGWEVKALGKIFANRQEKGFSELPLLSVTDERGIIPQEETNRKDNSNRDKSKYLRVVPGDIAYNTMRMWEGRSAYVEIEGLVSPAYTVCQPQNGVHGKYFSYYFKTSSLIEQFRKYSQGLVKDTLNLKYDGFACISVPSPLFAEQQKIADCLSSLDGLITAEGGKLAALRDHKRGLMQLLFPQSGQSQPRLRFPEFRDKGKWVEKILKEACEVNPSSDRLPDSFVYIDLESVEGGVLLSKKQIERTDAPSRAQRLLKNGDVVFQIVRPYQRNNLFFDFDNNEHYVASTGYAQLRAYESNAFLYQYVHTDPFVEKVIAKCTGSSYPAINSNDLAEVAVLVPDETEQQCIADCLTSIDNLISAQTNKINALKQHKRGLMQQLFPASEEL